MNKIPLLAIDPGPTYSALVGWDGERVLFKEKLPSDQVNWKVSQLCMVEKHGYQALLIEQVKLYQAADQNLHDTILWCGRFVEWWSKMTSDQVPCHLIPRVRIKAHITGVPSCKDGTVIAALKDRFGHPSRKIKLPEGDNGGILYGVTKDCWQALALAVYGVDKWDELEKEREYRVA